MRAPVCVVVLTALLLGGCHFEEAPDLLTVHRIDPERASAGDHLMVTGEGFPEGRVATVSFRGDVNRPGAPAEHDVRITARTTPAGRNALRLVFDPALERRFLRGAAHATFRGDLRVSFAPSASGLAHVSGSARGVRFDVLPSSPEGADADAPDGLEFLGIAGAMPEPGVTGIRVAEIDPEGRAAMAGVRQGDLLVDFDGVTVISKSDVTAHAGQRAARLTVERGGKLLPRLTVPVAGLAPLTPSDLIAAAAMVLLACALLVLPATRVGTVLRWMERLSDERLRRRGERLNATRAVPELVLVLLREGASGGALIAAALTLAAVVAGFLWIAVGRTLVSPEQDLLVLTLVPSVSLLVTRAIDGGFRGARFSAGGALGAALASVACVAPALLSIGGAVLASGRFVIGEMVADQGGMPWRWAATQNPGLFCLGLVLVASATPEALEGRSELPLEAPVPSPVRARASAARALLRLSEWAYLWVMCGLAVALFFGGYRVPSLSPWSGEHSRLWLSVGALLFVVKLVLAVCAVGAVRRLTSRVFVEHVALLAVRWVLPASAGALFVALAWAAALDGARSRMAAEGAGYALSAFAVVFAGHAARVAWSRRAPPLTAVNPWL